MSETPATTPTPEPQAGKINLLGLSAEKLAGFFAGIGEKRFRVNQVLKWMHQRGVTDFAEMTDLSKGLRETLTRVAEIRPPELVSEHHSADGTRKWLVRTDGGECVEAVFIPEKDRGTLCVSSQIGCLQLLRHRQAGFQPQPQQCRDHRPVVDRGEFLWRLCPGG